jgi:hypothetical protein
MSIFRRWFGRTQNAYTAKGAELRGDLARAAELFGHAGQPQEAARVMLLRADGETNARAKLQFLTQAAAIAKEGTSTRRDARFRRAELLLALVGEGTSALARLEIIEAAREFLAIGEHAKAAEAFIRAGEQEQAARALEAGGDIEELEHLLSTVQFQDKVERARDARHKDLEAWIAWGRRRQALAGFEALHLAYPEDASIRARCEFLRARRSVGPLFGIERQGERRVLVFGSSLTIGRNEGAIRVCSNAVSREHLRIERINNDVFVTDLGSRNGTQLRGSNVAGSLPIRESMELKLGHEIPLRIFPSARFDDAFTIEVGGRTYEALLRSNARIHAVDVSMADDGWMELEPSPEVPVFSNGIAWTERTTLLFGDNVTTSQGAEMPVVPAFTVVEP